MARTNMTSVKLDDKHKAIMELYKEMYVEQGLARPTTSAVLKEALMSLAHSKDIDLDMITAKASEISDQRTTERVTNAIPARYAGVMETVETLERYQELRLMYEGFFLITDNANIPNHIHPVRDSHHSEQTFSKKVIDNGGRNGIYIFCKTTDPLIEWSGAVPCNMCSR